MPLMKADEIFLASFPFGDAPEIAFFIVARISES